jgi:perosamine synthetase
MKLPDWIKKIKNPRLKGNKIIPIYSPVFAGNEKKYLCQCIDDSWISPKGNFVTKYEKAYAVYCGARYAIGCSSGTSALRLCLAVIGIRKNDEVILPTMTMISTALAVSYHSARPVFIDSNPETGNIDTAKIESAITKRTKAIISVHLYGNPAPMDEINALAKKYKLKVVEDGAEAIGAMYKNKKVGTLSDLTAFSSYVNKIVTTGQGGMITTDSKKLYLELSRLNNYYFSTRRHFWHRKIGYNLKLSNLQAAVGLAQLEKVDDLMSKKQIINKMYEKYLSPHSAHLTKFGITKKASSNFWMIAYLLNDKYQHAQPLRDYLATKGIETRTFFIPLHLQPPYRNSAKSSNFPVAEKLARLGMLLPSSPNLTETDIKYICTSVAEFFHH